MISTPRAFIWLKKISIWTNLNFLYSKYIHLLAICIEQTDKLQISYKINFVLFENFFHQMKAYDSLFKLYIKHFTLKFIFLSQIWLLFDLYWDNFYKNSNFGFLPKNDKIRQRSAPCFRIQKRILCPKYVCNHS